MNPLETKKFQARNLQGRMKHLSNQLEYLKTHPEEWPTFKDIMNMKFDHLISDSIGLGSIEAANYLALLQNQLNKDFNMDVISIVKDQFDEVLEALDSLGVELLINDFDTPEFAH